MIILKNISQLDKAAKKAHLLKPEVTVIEFGSYQVKGSKGDLYRVTMKLDANGNRLLFCSCEEKTRRKQNSICYHVAPALGIHILLAVGRVSYVGMLDKANTKWLRFKDED